MTNTYLFLFTFKSDTQISIKKNDLKNTCDKSQTLEIVKVL